jgi:hypothetical protein
MFSFFVLLLIVQISAPEKYTAQRFGDMHFCACYKMLPS